MRLRSAGLCLLLLVLLVPSPASATTYYSTNNSRIFPTGLWYEGHIQDINHPAAPPADGNDSRPYYTETIQQIKSWGLDSIATPNNDDGHIGNLLSAADAVGGMDVIAEPTDHFPNFTGTYDQAGTQVSTVTAANSNHKSLLYYQIADEPSPGSPMVPLRYLNQQLGLQDTAHPGFGSNCCGREAAAERILGYNQGTYDDYPITNTMPTGDSLTLRQALETWGSTIDTNWQATARDKPLYYVLQAYGNANGLRYPSPSELRYMTYDSLLRGCQGVYWFLYQVDQGMDGPVDLNYNQYSTGMASSMQTLSSELKVLAPWLVDAERDDPTKNGRSNILSVPSQLSTDYEAASFTTIFGERMVMLGNQWTASSRSFHAVIDSTGLSSLLNKGAITLQDVLSGATVPYTTTASTIEFDYTLNPGDFRLFRLQSPLSADIRIPKDSYYDPLSLGTTEKITVTLTNNGTTTWSPTSHKVGVHVYQPGGGYVDIASGLTGNTFAANVAPGQSVTQTLSVPTGTGTSLAANGVYQLGVDVYQVGTPNLWFLDEQKIGLAVVPTPLLVDTFDVPTFKRPSDFLWKWDRTGLMTIRSGPLGNALAINGGDIALSHWGSTWTDYTMELDVMIDAESPADSAYAGWVFRAKDTNNAYMFQLAASDAGATPNNIRKHTKVNGTYTMVQAVPTGLTIARNTWYHIKQVLSGTTIQTYINGTLIDTWTDSTFSSGKVGFRLGDGDSNGNYIERGHFRNVAVYTNASDTSVPSAPTGVTTAASGVGGVQLTWSRVQDATTGGADISHYNIYRSTTSGFTPGSGNLLAQPVGPSYLDTGLTNGTTYYYVISAVTGANTEGAYSLQASGVPTAAPAAVTGLTASVVNMKTVSLAWNASTSQVDHYNVYRSTTAGFTPAESNRITSVTTTSYQDGNVNVFVDDLQLGLRGLTTYYYAVVPVNAAGSSGTAATASTTTSGSNLFYDNFPTAAKWTAYAGTWAVSGGNYNQTNTSTSLANSSISGLKLANFVAEFQMKINSYGDPSYWAGMTIRKVNQADSYVNSGYVLYYRANGNLELYNTLSGVVATAATGISPTNWVNMRIEAKGYHIQAFVNGILFIDWQDPNSRSDRGYFDLSTVGTSTSFANVNIFQRDSFEYNALDGWTAFTGANWGVNTGILTLGATTNPGASEVTLNQNSVTDFTADYDVRIDSHNGNTTNWAGFTFRKTNPTDAYTTSGYLLFWRYNGQLVLYKAGTTLASATPSVAPTTFQQVRVKAVGGHIQVFINGSTTATIDYTDATPYLSGYSGLSTYNTVSRFDFLEMY